MILLMLSEYILLRAANKLGLCVFYEILNRNVLPGLAKMLNTASGLTRNEICKP